MALQPGTRMGAYQVAEVIGTGGMGEVWRATDTSLDRQVAIKVLPPSFAADAGRIARFEQEAKLLASLNHPNIAQVFGLERSAETLAIVMELVEGPTLADRIEQGPVPADDALGIAMQIADALEAAHDKGIVHRDLKPANIKLRPDGTVKVLDFGIAKAFDLEAQISGPQAPVMTTPVTQAGVILGTAAYMSPEQARGRAVDQRTDIWAFGCVLFEMLTGQPVFAGEDVSITLARVLERDTNLDSIPAAISPAVKQTIALCLRKDPARRLHSIGDVRLALRGELMADAAAAGAVEAARAPAPLWARALPLAAALVVGGAVVAGGIAMLAGREAAPHVTRLSEPFQPVAELGAVAISDDGTQIAFASGVPLQTMVRRIDEFTARPVPEAATQGLPNSIPVLCFSPDGDWIAHSTAGGTALRKTPIAGGRGLPLADDVAVLGSCDWADDGFVYFGGNAGIWRVSEAGGQAERVTTPNADAGEFSHTFPQLLPDGHTLLFTIVDGSVLDGELRAALFDLETQQEAVVLQNAGFAAFAATGPGPGDGYILYGQDRALFAAPFDLARREAGPPSPVLDDLMGIAGISFVAVSATGTLAYLSGDLFALDTLLMRVERDGSSRPVPESTATWGELSLSPDGQRSASGMLDLQSLAADLWILDFDGRRTRMTFAGFNGSIVWTPDGERLLYAGFDNAALVHPTLKSVPTDGSAQPTTIAAFDNLQAYPTSISPDGKVLIGTGRSVQSGGQSDVWALSLDDPGRDGPATEDDVDWLVKSGFNDSHATFSPDGRWIAYVSNESGTAQVYVIPYPGPGGKFQVSTNGGRQPRWNPDGSEIFYLSGPRMMIADVETGERFRAGSPRALFENSSLVEVGPTNGEGFQYSVMPGGQDFLFLNTGGGADQPQQVRIVENWFEELRRQVPR